jgi:uncharacterized Zn finger protein
VVELSVSPGLIEAKVQGARKLPYQVRLYASRPPAHALEAALRKLRSKAIYRATLLSGEAPPELDDIFQSSGVPLSLSSFARSQRMCTCSEPDAVCKHILAVMYVAASAFDRDPFMLMKLRGLDKNELMEILCAPADFEVTLGGERPGDPPDEARDSGEYPPEDAAAAISIAAGFYGSRELLPGVLNARAERSPESRHPMPIQDFPLWRGETSFADSVAPYYKTVRKFIADGEA